MKKLCLFLLLSIWFRQGLAQFVLVPASEPEYVAPSRWTPHVDSIFEHLDRSQVSTGLLANYGVALKDYHPFQGTALTAANKVQTPLDWRLLYAALQASTFNANATLPSLLLANQRIEQAQQNTAVVSIATLLARYDEFRADVGTSGLLTRSGQQPYDLPGRSQSSD